MRSFISLEPVTILPLWFLFAVGNMALVFGQRVLRCFHIWLTFILSRLSLNCLKFLTIIFRFSSASLFAIYSSNAWISFLALSSFDKSLRLFINLAIFACIGFIFLFRILIFLKDFLQWEFRTFRQFSIWDLRGLSSRKQFVKSAVSDVDFLNALCELKSLKLKLQSFQASHC